MNDKLLALPDPMLDEKELESMNQLETRYKKLMEPNGLIKIGSKAMDMLPAVVKDTANKTKDSLSELDYIKQAMQYAVSGFKTLEGLAAKVTVSEKMVVKKVDKTISVGNITSIDEICYARSYDIAKLVNSYKNSDILLATVEGAATGAFGFAGLVPNLVASTFLYFRAVQSVAMYYGYDVKNDASEMEIASNVFMSALTPEKDAVNNELTATIGKFMVFTETTVVKQTSKKTWTAMAEQGGLSLLITEIRALANVSAKRALASTTGKTLEQSVFKNILLQLGKQTTLKNTGKAMPGIGALFGALFDTAQMKKITEYADVFYNKRFIEEKEARINYLINPLG